MAEPVQVSGIGCLGRLLSFSGYAWVGLTLFGGFAALEEFGLNPGALGSVGGSIIPGFVLIAAGRALKKRGRVVAEKTESESEPTQETSPNVARRPASKPPTPIAPVPKKPTPVEPPPAPSRSLEDVLEEMAPESDDVDSPVDIPEVGEATPKTSAEMIEEAHRKWGAEEG